MKSIGQVRRVLPPEFLARLAETFPLAAQERILAGYGADRPVTLRANTLKNDIRELMAELSAEGVKFDRVLWYPEALVVKNRRERELSELAAYREGRLYLQSLSSMVPALVLQPRPGDRVLDLAAAPGGKTAQMAMLMRNRGHILANDSHPLRLERLRYNLARQGVTIAEATLSDGRALGKRHPESFDCVLLDAPCSGEGLFRASDPATWRHWSFHQVERLASLQRKLFASAWQALKLGGVLVYSTCTLAPEENECVVDWALAEYGDGIQTLPSPLALPDAEPALSGMPGREFSPEVGRAFRIHPGRLFEGFFVCLFRKTRPL